MASGRKKRPGLMLYFDDYASLRSSLSGEELVSVLDAMIRYAESGNIPDEESLSPAANICWRFMRPKIDRDVEKYDEVCEKRAGAAKKRWSSCASSEKRDASVCKCIESTHDEHLHDFMPTTTITRNTTVAVTATQQQRNNNADVAEIKDSRETALSPTADDDFDLSAQVADHQRADDLIRRYHLPDCDISREALLEDAELFGFEKLEEALQRAAFGNSRQGLSVNFYRTFLMGGGKRKEAGGFESYGTL